MFVAVEYTHCRFCSHFSHSFSLQHLLPLQLDANEQVECADGQHGQDEEDECADMYNQVLDPVWFHQCAHS